MPPIKERTTEVTRGRLLVERDLERNKPLTEYSEPRVLEAETAEPKAATIQPIRIIEVGESLEMKTDSVVTGDSVSGQSAYRITVDAEGRHTYSQALETPGASLRMVQLFAEPAVVTQLPLRPSISPTEIIDAKANIRMELLRSKARLDPGTINNRRPKVSTLTFDAATGQPVHIMEKSGKNIIEIEVITDFNGNMMRLDPKKREEYQQLARNPQVPEGVRSLYRALIQLDGKAITLPAAAYAPSLETSISWKRSRQQIAAQRKQVAYFDRELTEYDHAFVKQTYGYSLTAREQQLLKDPRLNALAERRLRLSIDNAVTINPRRGEDVVVGNNAVDTKVNLAITDDPLIGTRHLKIEHDGEGSWLLTNTSMGPIHIRSRDNNQWIRVNPGELYTVESGEVIVAGKTFLRFEPQN